MFIDYYSHFPNKRGATIIFYQTLTTHIRLNSSRKDVIQPPTDRTFSESSICQFDVNTLDRDVKINRRATFIKKMRVLHENDHANDIL